MTGRKFAPVLRAVHLFFLLTILLGMSAPAAMAQANVTGQWSTLNYQMTINPVHAALMHNGKILVIAGSGNCPPSQSGCPTGVPYGAANHSGATVLDPVAKTLTQLTLSWDMFCNSMTVLQDGRVFVNGGTVSYDPFHGQTKSSIFDPATNAFTDTSTNMAHGRWYPTVTLLPDGRIMTFSGQNENANTDNTVEIYTVGAGWSPQYTASWTPPLYPRQHLLPNGNVFVSGPEPTTYTFNPSTQVWTTIAVTKYGGTRTFGSSVLLPLTPANNYDPKVMLFGGSTSATNTTELIDLGAGSPSWNFGPDMSQARVEMDAVLLPTGKILALGGSASDESTPASLNADLFDPATNSMSSAGANSFARLYHSVALLLPDATVWSAGSNPVRGTWEPHMEIYQPAYLFNSSGGLATRPTITNAPGAIHWGGQFSVTTPDAANISQVVLVRPGSSTHAFDMDQRLVGMNFIAGSGTLTVTAPPNGNIAPPGYYMLFLINNSGVPSVAPFLLLNGGSNPAPTVSSISPAVGAASGGTAVTITGTGFLSAASVSFGGTAATGVSVVSSTSITATTPAHAAGAVNVVVTNTDGQSGTLSNGYTYSSGTGGGIVNFVQLGFATPASASASVQVTYPSAQTAGNLNVLAVGWNDTASTVSSVTDSRGNTYSLALGPTSGTGLRQSIYYAKNIAAGSNTVTVTFNQAAAAVDLRAMEYSGLDTTNPLDKTAGASGTGATASSGTAAATTSANELIVGAGMTAGTFTGAGNGFISRIITSPDADIAEDQTVSATGAYSATALGTSSNWVMQMASFRASGQSSGNPAPTVSSISPGTGGTAGGTAVTITGTGFLSGATVTLGGTSATGVTVVSATSITATTPAHAAGAVNVVVKNTDSQTGTLTGGYTYTNPAPTVSSISPPTGTTSGGTVVTITGTGFLSGATVSLGGNAATAMTVVSATSITATTPAHAAGAVNVVVTNTDTQSGTLTNGYTYTTSTGGGPIAFAQVKAATPQTASASVPITYTAAQTAGNLNVVVVGWNDTTSTVTGVTDTRGNTYLLAAGPTVGTGLTQSIYYAKNIAAGTNTVTVAFNKAAAFVDIRALEYSGLDTSNPLDQTASAVGSGTTSSSGAATTTQANELIFGAGMTGGGFSGAGTGFTSRVITSPDADNAEDRTVSATGSYAATAPTSSAQWVMQMATFIASGQTSGNPAPTVTSISPGTGTANGGTAVTITGTGFLSGATVTLGGTAATGITVVSATSITATTPAHAAGAVDVVVKNTDTQTGTLSGGYTYTPANPAPTVTSISPGTGTTAGGTAVTITGTGFLSGATVTLGGASATGVTVVSATSITATTSAHAAGPVNVVVKNTDSQTGTLSTGYTYTAANPAPTVTSISPGAGPTAGGTAVTITGTGFLSGAAVSLGGTAATGVTVVSATSITATTPAHAGGAVSVVVTNTDAQSGTLTNGFTYTNPAPTVTSISPGTGTTAGGTAVTIGGTGFLSGATVSLGGTAATGVTVVSSTSITATTPAHAAGGANVVVTNTDAQSGTLTNGYTYTTSGGGGPIAFVQVKSATPQTASASVAVAFTAAQTLGNLNLVVVGWNDTTSTVSAVTDSQGNTYALAIGPTIGTGLSQSIYYAKNIAAGTNTVTVTFNKAAAFVDIRALEYSGLDAANPLDQKAGAVGNSATASSGAATTTAANELIFGAGMTANVFTGAGTGFVSRIITTPDADIAEDSIVNATGSYSATAPNKSSNWVMQMVTFQKAQ